MSRTEPALIFILLPKHRCSDEHRSDLSIGQVLFVHTKNMQMLEMICIDKIDSLVCSAKVIERNEIVSASVKGEVFVSHKKQTL